MQHRRTVVGEHHVGQGHGADNRVAGGSPLCHTDRGGQRIGGVPVHLQDQVPGGQRVDVRDRFPVQPHREPRAGITEVQIFAGAGGIDQQQHVALDEAGIAEVGRDRQVRAARTGRQHMVGIAPGVQVDAVAGRAQVDVGAGLEHDRPGLVNGDRQVARYRCSAGDRCAGPQGGRHVGGQRQPDPRRAPLVHPVVQQAGMAAHRCALYRRAEVRLGSHCVLPVRQPVAEVGEQLGEHHRGVGRAAVGPLGHEHGHAVQQPGAQCVVVARQVVGDHCGQRVGGGCARRRAVEIGRAVHGEGEGALRQRLVEAVRDPGVVEQVQHVRRPVPAGRGPHHEHPLGIRRQRRSHQGAVGGGHAGRGGRQFRGRVRPDHRHRIDPRIGPHTAAHRHPGAVPAGRHRAIEQVHQQGALRGGAGHVAGGAGMVGQHLDEVDALELGAALHECPAGVAVEVGGEGHGPPPETTIVRD